MEKYIAFEPISQEKLAREEQQRVQDASLFSLSWQRKMALAFSRVMDAVTGCSSRFPGTQGRRLCGSVYEVQYTGAASDVISSDLYSGTLRLQNAVAWRKKLKITGT